MLLFLPEGFVLDPATLNHKLDAQSCGEAAEHGLLAFLKRFDSKAEASGFVVKWLRSLHNEASSRS